MKINGSSKHAENLRLKADDQTVLQISKVAKDSKLAIARMFPLSNWWVGLFFLKANNLSADGNLKYG